MFATQLMKIIHMVLLRLYIALAVEKAARDV